MIIIRFLHLPPAPFQVQINDEHQPSDSFDHSAYGARLSILKGGWDISSFYYSTMDPSPAFFRTTQRDPVPLVIFQPDHDRIHQIGFTASKDFASFIIMAKLFTPWIDGSVLAI